ncbi:MAG: hypothetical protein HY043_06825 [Verrucomicrobia bacterium]|nr:hypothetical protein [Verrucomicrobiota bacterium]
MHSYPVKFAVISCIATKPLTHKLSFNEPEDITQQVQQLPPTEVFTLGQWLREYEASLWDQQDQQIEADLRAGKLDKHAQKAFAESRERKIRPFLRGRVVNDVIS